MKKQVKKLCLSKETLSTLDRPELSRLIGGGSAANTTCPCFDGSRCDCTAICSGFGC